MKNCYVTLIKHCWCLALILAVSGCAHLLPQDEDIVLQTNNDDIRLTQASDVQIHQHVERIFRQLLDTSRKINSDEKIAVGTILPANLSNDNPLPESHSLGLQIQDSLVTLATQVGLSVTEFKTTNKIVINQHQDKMLSRQQNDLSQQTPIKYFLTGTYSQQEHNMVVNLRLIELPSKTLIAAATDYIPLNVAANRNKIIAVDNHKFNRTGY
ncbi:FlgO family outer membrane protein [Alteromonadaceae bacterium BrNp21-10]|nr:FlgO family outer membrane protein [Alteromonadaceae bacterium BrNp21-10]